MRVEQRELGKPRQAQERGKKESRSRAVRRPKDGRWNTSTHEYRGGRGRNFSPGRGEAEETHG